MAEALEPLTVRMPPVPGLAVLATFLEDQTGRVLQRNFTTFLVTGEGERAKDKNLRLLSFDPKGLHRAQWSVKQWNVLEGLKINGAGWGHFEYRVPWPADLDPRTIREAGLPPRGRDRSNKRSRGSCAPARGP